MDFLLEADYESATHFHSAVRQLQLELDPYEEQAKKKSEAANTLAWNVANGSRYGVPSEIDVFLVLW